jgi:hypothetical protein
MISGIISSFLTIFTKIWHDIQLFLFLFVFSQIKYKIVNIKIIKSYLLLSFDIHKALFKQLLQL